MHDITQREVEGLPALLVPSLRRREGQRQGQVVMRLALRLHRVVARVPVLDKIVSGLRRRQGWERRLRGVISPAAARPERS